MLQEFELFSKFFPEEYLNTVEIEYQKIKEETKIMAYLKAFTEVLEKLILDESVYTTFKKGFSQNEINNILKMTIRLIFFSLEEKGVTGLINKDVFTGNEDPTIKSWYSFLYMKQQDIETKYKNLQNEWKKLEKISHSDNINIILDKLDILFIVIKMAQQKLDQKNLEKFIQLFFEIIQSAEPKELILQLYSIIGKTTDAFIKMSQGNMDAAKKLIDQTLEEAKELQNPFIKSQVYNILGVYLSGEGHLNNALKQYQLSAEYATKISQQSYRYMAALANISDIYLRQGKYEEGLAITNKAIEIFTDQAFVPKLNKAHIISLQGNHTEALREIEGILEDYPAETIDKNYYFYLRRIQFESYIELSEFEKAEEVILEMDQMITSSKAKQFQAYIFYFQGLIEFKKVNFTLAKQLLLKAIESSYKAVDGLSLRLKAEFQLSNVLLNSYKFSESINDFQKALTLMETVIKAAEEQNIYILLCNALTIHARMLDIQDKEKQAISSLKKALSIANNYDLTVIKKRIEEQLALLEKQTEKVSKKEKTTGLIGYLAKFLRSMLTFEGTT